MCYCCKVVCIVNSWNLAVSQCNLSCSICSISFDFEHPLVPNQSPVLWYFCSVCFSPDSPVDHAPNFQFDGSSPIISVILNWIVPCFLKVLGSVGPDVSAEIKQVSSIQSSIVRYSLSMDSFLGDDFSLV